MLERFSYLKNAALDFALLVVQLYPIEVVISLPLQIKLHHEPVVALFSYNFCSFFSYVGGALITNLFSANHFRKPSRSVTKLSHLKARKSAHHDRIMTAKLHHDCGLDTNNGSANHLRYKSNHIWWKYHVNKFLFLSSYLCKFLLLVIFLSNNFDFICSNNKQVYFVKMHPTMMSEYFFVGNSINKLVQVTTRDKQLLKFEQNLQHLNKNKDSQLYMVSDCCNSAVFVINSFKNQSSMQAFENVYTFFINFWEIMIASIVLFIYLLNKIVLKGF